ncbi:NADPH-dependent FMN reductase [Halobacteriales archaeon Cl-PHB]
MSTHRPELVAVCGSLRDESRTRIALRVALDAATAAGADTTLVDLREYDVPPLYDRAETPPDAVAVCEAVDAADAVLLGSPNYHGSYTGAMKDALDHCGRDEFADTVVGLLEVAGGSHPGGALTHLRTVCRTLNAWTHPLEVAIPDSASQVTADGIADAVEARVERLGEELTAYAGLARYPDLAVDPPRQKP